MLLIIKKYYGSNTNDTIFYTFTSPTLSPLKTSFTPSHPSAGAGFSVNLILHLSFTTPSRGHFFEKMLFLKYHDFVDYFLNSLHFQKSKANFQKSRAEFQKSKAGFLGRCPVLFGEKTVLAGQLRNNVRKGSERSLQPRS